MLSQHTASATPHEHIVAMARNMDLNKDGQIDFNEFLETFRIVDQFGRELNDLTRRSSYEDEEDQSSSQKTLTSSKSTTRQTVSGNSTASGTTTPNEKPVSRGVRGSKDSITQQQQPQHSGGQQHKVIRRSSRT